jgi:hypothetical protein
MMKKQLGLGILLLSAGALAGSAALEDWYAFKPSNNCTKPSVIGMENWNSEPAGAHGRVESKGEKLFYDGKEIKLWGLNNCYMNCAPEKDSAERHAALYRKFGFNAIRFHKYADGSGFSGILTENSAVEFDPARLDRMDYYVSALKKNGIYTKFSPTFGVKFTAKDATERGEWLKEFGDFDKKGRVRAPYGSVFMAKELQEIQIEQTTKILNHKNPYTGMRYADDPAIFCVELFNEDSVLFGGVISSFKSSPTLRTRIAGQFSDWLLKKYGTEAAWRKAWGDNAIIDNAVAVNKHLKSMIDPDTVKGGLLAESLTAKTVLPWCQPWFDDAALKADGEQAFLKQRLLDSMVFLIGLQDDFYARFAAALRATGYQGQITGSNWQAGSLAGHFLNLYSDARLTIVDRHNYFGGGRGATKNKKPFSAGSMLASPGMGMLSAGMQQVNNKPFMLSEWIHVSPNEWMAESPAIMGAYGFGLQGWDVSYIFENGDNGGFSDTVARDSWDVSLPTILGPMAAIARQVRRMDVTEAPGTTTLNVNIPAVKEGKVGFNPKTVQSFDTKSFTSAEVPMDALAVTRVAVDFTDQFKETPAFDLSSHRDGNTLVSTTGQLRWTPSAAGSSTDGYFTMNTAGTKAFVGFAPGEKTFDLGDGYTITPAKGFAVIYLTAKNPGETLASASEIVVVAMARARNTGMQFNDKENTLLELGTKPILLEPVHAEITVPFSGTLDLLDHDGSSAAGSRKVDGKLSIDGERDRTPFYLIRK